MTKFDRESFNLLKMTDSASDSVPDLAFDIPQNSRQKKKVRLKRFAQYKIMVGNIFTLEGTAHYAGLPPAPAEGFGLWPRLLWPSAKSLLVQGIHEVDT